MKLGGGGGGLSEVIDCFPVAAFSTAWARDAERYRFCECLENFGKCAVLRGAALRGAAARIGAAHLILKGGAC